jgi:hypothetical protein
VVQKYAVEDINIHFTISMNNIPPLNFKEFMLNFYKSQKKLVTFDPINTEYNELNLTQIHLVDPAKLTIQLNDLQDPSKIEDAVLLANTERKNLTDYYKEKGLLVEIDSNTQELIKDSSEFNTLPEIKVPTIYNE